MFFDPYTSSRVFHTSEVVEKLMISVATAEDIQPYIQPKSAQSVVLQASYIGFGVSVILPSFVVSKFSADCGLVPNIYPSSFCPLNKANTIFFQTIQFFSSNFTVKTLDKGFPKGRMEVGFVDITIGVIAGGMDAFVAAPELSTVSWERSCYSIKLHNDLYLLAPIPRKYLRENVCSKICVLYIIFQKRRKSIHFSIYTCCR